MFAHEIGRPKNLSHLQEQPRDGRYNQFDDICMYVNIIALVKSHSEETCDIVTLNMRHGRLSACESYNAYFLVGKV